MVAIVVLSFFGVVLVLGGEGQLNWGEIFGGFVPDLSQWTKPTGSVATLVDGMSADVQVWSATVVQSQRDVMIGAAATAVGINMTFLLRIQCLHEVGISRSADFHALISRPAWLFHMYSLLVVL